MIKEPTEDIIAASIGKLVPSLFSDALVCIDTVNKKLSLTIETLQTLMEQKVESLHDILNLVKEIREDFDKAKKGRNKAVCLIIRYGGYVSGKNKVS
jgi:hypothetical protein